MCGSGSAEMCNRAFHPMVQAEVKTFDARRLGIGRTRTDGRPPGISKLGGPFVA